MQRLKQFNSGAALPLSEDELLIASTTYTRPDGVWYLIRMRVERSGWAERAVDLHAGPDGSGFSYHSVQVSPEGVNALSTALEEARVEAGGWPQNDDPNALYRSVRHWYAGKPSQIAAEYWYNKPRYPSPRFQTLWRLLTHQFHDIGAVQAEMPDASG